MGAFVVACLLSLSINIALPLADGGTLGRVKVVEIFLGRDLATSFHSLATFCACWAYVSGAAGEVGLVVAG